MVRACAGRTRRRDHGQATPRTPGIMLAREQGEAGAKTRWGTALAAAAVMHEGLAGCDPTQVPLLKADSSGEDSVIRCTFYGQRGALAGAASIGVGAIVIVLLALIPVRQGGVRLHVVATGFPKYFWGLWRAHLL
ncbi:MAG: hypothetical protein R2911_43665 [Caldilineaceae bacterium]